MSKKAFHLILMCLIVLFFGTAHAITIDGTNDPGEWTGAAVFNAALPGATSPVVGTVSVFADTSYLYGLFDVTGDSIDDRVATDHGEKLGININRPGNMGYPNDIMFQIAMTAEGWGGTSAGAIDGFGATQWNLLDIGYTSLPTDLETVTLYDTGHRVTELMIPLASIVGLSVGDTLRVGGAVDFNVNGAGLYHPYPAGMNWSIEQYGEITVADAAAPVPEPATMLLLSSGLVGLVGFRKKFRKS